MKPDMRKVRAAVTYFEAKKNRRKVKDWRIYPPTPSPEAQDAAIRKPLTNHGTVCCGFGHPHFLQNEP